MKTIHHGRMGEGVLTCGMPAYQMYQRDEGWDHRWIEVTCVPCIAAFNMTNRPQLSLVEAT